MGLLFKNMLETNLELNLRQRLLLAYITLEKTLTDLCVENKIILCSDVSVQDLALKLFNSSLIDNELIQTIQESILKQEMLIPKVESLGDLEFSYELAQLVESLTKQLAEK